MGVRSRRRAAAALVFSAVLVLLTVGPASATLYSREWYSGTDSFSYECGAGNWIDVQAEFSGLLILRQGTGADRNAFFAHNNYSWSEVHTNRDTGKWIALSGDGLFQETRATRVSGSIFTFSSVNAGQVFVVRDSDSNVILRDRGAIKETILFDTLGDATPGGTFISSVEFSVAGPHPGFFYDTCTDIG